MYTSALYNVLKGDIADLEYMYSAFVFVQTRLEIIHRRGRLTYWYAFTRNKDIYPWLTTQKLFFLFAISVMV